MKIDLTELLEKVGNDADIEESEEISFPEDNLNLTSPVAMKLHLVNIGSSVLVEGKVTTEAQLECSRCLEKFKFPLSIDIEEEFTKELFIASGSNEIELKEGDFTGTIERDNTIDLAELIRQDLLLALPIKTLCAQDCKGIGGK
ncbi:MAG: DUF177 domain-containing protein [Candidatus Saganbacteria bacterium]|nr:DUF177 domain-containing protein [Candidatus Saganbacteria bacterium]